MHTTVRTIVLLMVSLVLLCVGCDDTLPSETEDNGTPDLADVIDSSTYKGEISTVGDNDYWTMQVNADGNYHSFTLSHLDSDLQLMLYATDSDGHDVDASLLPGGSNPIRSDNAGTMNEQITILPTARWNLILLVQESGDTLANETGSYWLQYERY
ncbi:MAG: hypothetical protein AB7C91_12785 [Sphaerochaeta sp.]|jgi:hypothetical protein|uniref:hypothetical protein n=1 Tax=Sphaerochaeta sp. TaxID=1972642 RepID=UPI002FCA302A